IFGLGYTLGRALSVLSLVAIVPIAALSIAAPRHRHVSRGPTWAGVVIAFGLFAAAYPYVEGWYDLVRADTLFLFLVTAGIAAAARWAGDPARDDVRTSGRMRAATPPSSRVVVGKSWTAHARVAAVAAILVYAFFCKQTGIF